MKWMIAFFFWSGLCGSALAVEVKLPVPQLETLPNGLTLAWFVSDKLPVVDIALLIKSGHRDDPAGKSGTSELLAASMERGAGGQTAQQLARQVEMMGASSFVSADEETFSQGVHGLAPDAEPLLEILARIALQPDLPEAEVAREHARILDRWRHIGDYGETLASIAYRRLLTSGTTYGRGGFVSVKEFKKVSRADVAAFHKKHFTPKNAVLMVVGRVDQPKFREKIVSLFGNWQGEAPKREWKSFADKRLPKGRGQIVIVDRPSLTQAQVRMGFRAPLLNAPEHYPLVVGNALLGEYFHSRLNTLIRDKLALTYGIGSSFSYNKELATFTVGSATRNETVGQLIDKTIGELRNLKKGPVSEGEVTMAKEYLVGSFPLSTSTLGAVASRWLAGHIFDLGPGYLNEFVPKVSAVKREEVQSAMTKNLKLEDLVIVVAGDGKEIEKSIRAAGLAAKWKIRRVSTADLF